MLGKTIKKRRELLGRTLEEVSKWTDREMSRSSVWAVEQGSQELDVYDFFCLEKILGELPRPDIKIRFE